MQARKLITAALPLMLAAAASAQQIVTTVNGNPVDFEGQEPILMNNRVMVPVRGVFEEMGVHVEWDAQTRQVYATGNGREATLKIDSPYATVNGQTVELDTPPIIMHGRTLVPLRFVSESMGAVVNWHADTHTVAVITTGATGDVRAQPIGSPVFLSANTVIPFELNTRLNSATAKVGDTFTATLDTPNQDGYEGLPEGTIIEGHVSTVRPKTDDVPGVLGLEFNRMRLPDGRTVNIDGSLIGLDNNSVTNEGGRLVAKEGARDDMKYVGIGAGAGALIAIATEGNILTSALIGGALGYLYDQIRAGQRESKNVVLDEGTRFGVALDQSLTIR